jgi:hypothetical protein
MKRIAALFMLVVFALNALGFYGIFLGVQAVQTELTSRKINEETFSGSQTITFRIPLSLPYRTDDTEYQQAHGQFENNGEVYRLVKQKLLRDTLYIVCLKDADSKKINQDIVDYVKTFSDKPSDSHTNSTSKLVSNFSKDYLTQKISISIDSYGWIKVVAARPLLANLIPTFKASIVHPPERIFSL